MIKSGIVLGIVSLIVILGSGLILPWLAPCWGIFLGLIAGYLAGVFDKPAASGDTAKKGAIAAVIAAVFGLVGGLIAGVINSLTVNPQDLVNLYKMLGLDIPNIDQTTIWVGQLGIACCIGFFNLALMAGFGAAGGALWWQTSGKNQASLTPPMI
jgi:hypothetical protein